LRNKFIGEKRSRKKERKKKARKNYKEEKINKYE
jgi:hypothetical protein